MKRLLSVFACAFLFAVLSGGHPTHAAALQGTIIRHVTDDKAFYSAGSPVTVTVDLNPQTNWSGGTLSLAICSRGVALQTQSQTIGALTSGKDTLQTFALTAPSLYAGGYQIVIAALNSGDKGTVSCTGTGSTSSSPADVATGAILIANRAQDFPIEAFIDPQAMQSVTNYAAIADNMAQFHINIVQAYDWGYRHDAPYTPSSTWQNLQNVPVTRSETQGVISAFHKYGVFMQLYTSWNNAYPDWLTQNPSMTAAMGVYTDQCGLTASCTVNDQLYVGGGWLTWGWLVDKSVEQNPFNAYWATWLQSQNRLALTGWGFDGIHLDTMGDSGRTLYDSRGRQLPNLGVQLTDFANAMQSALGVCTDINRVSWWNLMDGAVREHLCNMYVEPHPEFGDGQFFPTLNGQIETLRSWTSRPLIVAYYPQQVMSGSLGTSFALAGDTVPVCDPSKQSNCMANDPGIELLMGQVALSGASQLLLGDFDHIVPGPFFPRATLGMDGNLQQWLLDYYNWVIGQRDILYGKTVDATDIISLTDSNGNSIGSPVGAAGKIYYRSWARAGTAAGASLTNLVGLNDNRIDDPDGLHKPVAQANVAMTMTYYGQTTPGTLWYSSPDLNHGIPQALAYTTSSATVNGTTVNTATFTIPSLQTVGLVTLEAGNLSTTNDYRINTADFIRGGTANWSVNGMGTTQSATVHGCCRRWARWDAVDFGSSSTGTMTLLANSQAGAPVEFRLDAPDGPLVASGRVAPGGSTQTMTLPLLLTLSGVHSVYALFPGRDVSLVGWKP